jgi:hypothetical protein
VAGAVLAALLTVVLGSGLGVVAVVIGVNLAHPRDEAGYLSYLRTYGDMTSDQPIALPPRSAVLAAGQDACSWLGGSGYALWRTDLRQRFSARMSAYLRSADARTLPWSGLPERSTVAAAAWAYLCPATWQLHKPHYVFTSSPGD